MKISNTMKKILLILGVVISLLAAHVVIGQTTEGIILYEVKVNMHRRMPPEDEAMRKVIPEYNVFRDQLAFNAEASLYKSVDDEEEEQEFNDGNGIRMNIRRPQVESYVHAPTQTRLVVQEFMGKKYRIEDTLKITPWKLSSETKTILGYNCAKASYYNEERRENIVVWYTDKLRATLGPEGFNSLPGAVLQVNINEGERIVTATKIESRKLEKNELKLPSGGTKISAAEFKKIRDEQFKKTGGGTRVIIGN